MQTLRRVKLFKVLILLSLMVIAAVPTQTKAQNNDSTSSVISPTNVNLLQQVGQLGQGTVQRTIWTDNGKHLIVITTIGVLVYDTAHLDIMPPMIPINGDTAVRDLSADAHVLVYASGADDDMITLLDIPSGHTTEFANPHGSIDYLKIAPDHESLIVESTDANGYSWSELFDLRTHSASVLSASDSTRLSLDRFFTFSPNSQWLAEISSDDDSVLNLLDSKTGELLRTISVGEDSITTIKFTDDSNNLVIASDYNAIVDWDLTTNKPVKQFTEDMHPGVRNLNFSPDGTLLMAMMSTDSTNFLDIWNWESGQRIMQIPIDNNVETNNFSLSPNNKLLLQQDCQSDYFDSQCQTTTIWTMPLIGKLPLRDVPINLAISPDSTLMSGSNSVGQLQIQDLRTGLARPVVTNTGQIRAFALSPDGRKAAWTNNPYSQGNPDQPAPIQFGNIDGHQQIALRGASNSIETLKFSSNGSQIISIGGDNRLLLWRTDTGKPRFTLSAYSATFSPDETTFLVSTYTRSGKTTIYDAATLQPRFELDTTNPGVFSRDGKTIITGDPKYGVKLWNAQTGENIPLALDKLGTGNVYLSSYALSPDNKFIAAINQEVIRVWQTADGKSISLIQGKHTPIKPVRVLFSPDSRYFITYGSTGLWTMDTSNFKTYVELQTNPVTSVTFSPDGRLFTIASGSDLVIRDYATRKVLRTISGPWGRISDLKFSADGTTLAFIGDDGVLRIWGIGSTVF